MLKCWSEKVSGTLLIWNSGIKPGHQLIQNSYVAQVEGKFVLKS